MILVMENTDAAVEIASRMALPSGSQCILIAAGAPGSAPVAEAWAAALKGHRVLASAPARMLQPSERALCILARANRLPFTSHAFDGILSFAGLQAARPSATVLAEYHRVLKSGGRLALCEPYPGWAETCRSILTRPALRQTPSETVSWLARTGFKAERCNENIRLAGRPCYCVTAIREAR